MISSLLFGILAGAMMWAAADVKRKDDSRVKIYSPYWWLQMALFVGAVLIYKYCV